MTHVRTSAKNWFRKNEYVLFPFLAFVIPLIVRAVPEVLMGKYLVGFDTIGYYVPNILTWLGHGVSYVGLISSSPLLYILLMGITFVGAPLVVTLKVLGPLLLGLLALATYFYANKGLNWSSKKSLTVALLSTLYFVALRISWDMFRSELALIFLFLTLIILQKNSNNLKKSILLSATMALTVLSHQLIAIIMLAIIMATIIDFFLKKKKNELRNIIICSVPAAFLIAIIIYINYFIFSSPVLGYSINYSGGFEGLATITHVNLILDTLGFLAFCYLPLVPLFVFGFKKLKRNIHLEAWIIWLFIPLLIVIVSPNSFFVGGILPYRWILLLTYPLCFYAVEGLFSIKWNWYKSAFKAAIVVLIMLLSVSFLVLPNNGALNYFGAYPTYVPKSMLQNTLQLSDCQDTTNALLWAQNNMPGNGYLLVHAAFYGSAMLDFDNNRLVPYFFGNLTAVTNTLLENNSTLSLYLIWWVNGKGWYGQPSAPASFKELYQSGDIAIYQYAAAS